MNIFGVAHRTLPAAVFLALWLGGVGASAQLQAPPGPPQNTPGNSGDFIVTFRPGTS